MLEYLVVLKQLYDRPNIDVQAAVQQALAGPKVASVSGAEPSSSLDSKLSISNLQPREFSLDQVKGALSKPYLNVRTEPSRYYSDWLSRGELVKYAFNNFSTEQLMEIRDYVIDHSLRGIVFTTYSLSQDTQRLSQTIESMLQILGGRKVSGGKAPGKAKSERMSQRAKMLDDMSKRIYSTQQEIWQLMKDKDIS